MTTEYFTLNDSGLILWVENMPEEPKYALPCSGVSRAYLDRRNAAIRVRYNEALQSAISNAIEVSNQREVENQIRIDHRIYFPDMLEVGTPYPLQCHVEKKEFCASDICDTDGQCEHCREPKTVALVTFSEPEERPSTSSIVRKFERFLDNRKNPPFEN